MVCVFILLNICLYKYTFIGRKLVTRCSPEFLAFCGQITSQAVQKKVRTIIDFGCGTGLVGPLVRALTENLVGVDISENMLAKAAERKVYDMVVKSDGVTYLDQVAAGGESVDVIVAADVFIYIGDLDRVFAAASGALTPTGSLVFTVEELLPSVGEESSTAVNSDRGNSAHLPCVGPASSMGLHLDEELRPMHNTQRLSTSAQVKPIYLPGDSDESLTLPAVITGTVGSDCGSGASDCGSGTSDSDSGTSDYGSRGSIGNSINSSGSRGSGIDGLKLLSCGRFGHSEQYIRTLAVRHGFQVAACSHNILRLQAGAPVKSITFTLQNSGR